MTRKVVLVILALVLMMGVSGCMFIKEKPTIKEQVEKQLGEKYHEKFTVYGGGTESWDAHYTEIYATSEKFPDARIMVRRNDKSGEMIDNYMDYLMQDKIEAVMNDIVRKIYPKSKVIFDTHGSPLDGTTPGMSVEDYIKYIGKHVQLSLAICVYDPDYKRTKDKNLETLRKVFEESEYRPDFTIFYLASGKMESVNDKNINDLYNEYPRIADWILLRGDFSIEESYQYGKFSEWREVNE